MISSDENDMWRGQPTEMLGGFGRSISSFAVVAGIEEVPNQDDNVWAMVVNDPLQLVVQRFALMEIGCGENRDNCRHRRILVLQAATAMNQKGECLLSSTEYLRPRSQLVRDRAAARYIA
jgi:hypothetical protein